jgi:carbon-monoxide dehydrogenase large subunit
MNIRPNDMPPDAVGGEPGEGIGRPVLRKEDIRFITGRGRYTSDLAPAGALHAAFVRSPYACAELKAIDVTAALDSPGVVAVLTGEDLLADSVGVLALDFVARNFDGRPMATPPRRALSAGVVRYVGEPVAIVIAQTRHQAEDGVEAVAVDYDSMSAVVTMTEAVAPEAPILHPDAAGNVACDFRYGKWDEVEKAFAAAAHVVRLDHDNNRIAVNPLEPRSAVARYDPLEDRYSLLVSHQTPFPLRTQISEALKIPEQRLHVVSPDVGGGFGVKGPTYPEEVALVWAARRLGQTISWECRRSELFLSDAQARDHVTTIELALAHDGEFLAIRVNDLANLGAYVSSFGAGPPLFGQTGLLCGAYRTPLIAGRVRMVFTNTMPTDAYRGPGRAECAYMLERVVDVAARRIGMSPVELRRRNMIAAASMPWRTATDRLYDSGDFPAVFEKALRLAKVDDFPKRRLESGSRGKLRGLGIAYYIDHTGMGPSDLVMSRGMAIPTYESSIIRFNKDGGVTVVTGTHTHGQGLETALAQIVSDRLGVPISDIEVLHGDTRDIGYGRGTVGARSLLAGGAALDVAIDKLVEKGKKIAAHMLECATSDVEFRDRHFGVKGTDRRVPLSDVARAAYFPVNFPIKELEPGFEESGYWDPKAVAFPNGCHVCELEIDKETGTMEILDFVSVDDFGNIINPLLVAGQVHGGIAQGIGQAVKEHCVYEEGSGQLLTGSLMDYGLPRASDMPPFRHETHAGQPCTTNPLGVKGCGEAGAVGAPPAVINAVVDALSEFGVEHVDMPASPSKLWGLIHKPPR